MESNFSHYLTVHNSAERKPGGRVAWPCVSRPFALGFVNSLSRWDGEGI
jgi:hypothetical protein